MRHASQNYLHMAVKCDGPQRGALWRLYRKARAEECIATLSEEYGPPRASKRARKANDGQGR